MKRRRLYVLFFLVMLIQMAAVLLLIPATSQAVFYQKHYVVEQDRGRDILCDPYVVQPDDYVLKLLEQRGDIAYKDFPKFLEIFMRINPDVRDLDLIYPNQHLLIPLRILEPETLEGQESGRVSIPVIPITSLPEAFMQFSDPYTVQYGDWISRLIAKRFGKYGSDGYRRGFHLFKILNPEIKDPDSIKAGSRIRLPKPSARNQPWFNDLTNPPQVSGQLPDDSVKKIEATAPEVQKAQGIEPAAPEDAEVKDQNKAEKEDSPVSVQWFADLSVVPRAAQILDVKIFDKGRYFFPRAGRDDLALDLSRTPMLEAADGRKFLLTRREWLTPGDQAVLQVYWSNLDILFVPRQPALTWLLEKLIPKLDPDGYEKRSSIDENGIATVLRGLFIYRDHRSQDMIYLNILSDPDMFTPKPVCEYLQKHGFKVRDWVETSEKSGWVVHEKKQSRAVPDLIDLRSRDTELLVRSLVEEAGYAYHGNVEVCFPYAGFQVRAVTNLLSLGQHAEMLIDFGNLQGDAVAAIEKTGFKVLQIPPGATPDLVLRRLAKHLSFEIMPDPIFWAARRPRIYNISVQVPGFLVSIPGGQQSGDKKVLLSRAPVPDELAAYFAQETISVIRMH